MVGALVAVAAISFGLGSRAGSSASPELRQKIREYTDLVNAAEYWSAEDVGTDKLVYSSVRGMLSTLDPHTYFLEPTGYSQMREKESGSYSGVGLLVTMRNGQLTVITPFQGSPAARLGVRAGDVILEIDGFAATTMGYEQAVGKLKGPKGSTVTVKISRSGLDDPMLLTIIRAAIPTNSVAAALILRPGVGYIRVTDFTGTTAREFSEAVTRLQQEGMRNLILDLRGNPGGSLDAALDMADQLLVKGDLIVFTKGRTADSNQQFLSPGRHTQLTVPIVVLVDHGTASASEIVAGAVQDHDRGIVAGQTSWGKGLVQGVYSLQYGAGLALTTARYYTPSGRNIQRDFSSLYDYYVEDGTTVQHSSETFKTITGRIVYGGGGITPDVAITPHKLSRITQVIEGSGLLFDLGVELGAKMPKDQVDVEITPAMLDRLIDAAIARKVGSAADIRAALDQKADRDYLSRSLVAEITAARRGYDASWAPRVAADEQVARAEELLPAAQKLAEAAAKARAAAMASGVPAASKPTLSSPVF
jgi:carboxyl-terminal processing protease